MVTLVVGIGVDGPTSERVLNLKSCLAALQQQTLSRDLYRIVIVEQGAEPKLDGAIASAADEYVFAYSPRPFNRSWVLNIGATRAAPGVICTFDADLVVPSNFLRRGFLAWQCGALAIRPYKGVLYMDAASTQRVHEEVLAGKLIDCDAPYYRGGFHPWSKGGCIWIDSHLYHEIGGHDERFEGWGDEDREFWDRLTARTEVARLDGRLLHLDHARDFQRKPEVRANRILWRALQNGVVPPSRSRVIGDVNRFRAPHGVEGAPRRTRAAMGSFQCIGREELRQAILDDAMRVCRGVPAWDGRDPQRLHLRGLLAARKGDDGTALACLTGAVRLAPRNPDYLVDLGRVLIRHRRAAESISAQLRAITLDPDDPVLYRALGRTLVLSGRLAEAMLVYREALQLDLGDAQTFGEIGDLFLAQRKLDGALSIADALKRKDIDGHLRVGRVRLARGEWKLALGSFRQGLALVQAPRRLANAPDTPGVGDDADDLWRFRASTHWLDDPITPAVRPCGDDGASVDPRLVMLHTGIGEALFRLGAMEEAIDSLTAALTLSPRDLSAACILVVVCEALGRKDDAVGAWISLGGALQARRRFDEAIVAYRQAVAHKPGCLRALIQLGRVQMMRGKLTDAIQTIERALATDPDSALAHTEMGCLRAASGDMDAGWREFAWWCRPLRLQPRAFEQPLWDGSLLTSRRILIWADQELGDTIHWLRYVPALERLGGRVVVECQARLAPIVRTIPGIQHVVAHGAPQPAFDVHVPITLLPVISTTCRSNPCRIPYMRSDTTLANLWRRRLAKAAKDPSPARRAVVMTIGLCWAGHPEGINGVFRFAPLTAFATLVGLRGLRFISLQMGPQTAEMLAGSNGLHLEHLQDESCSMADTAALMENLDLIITVDTMIAHLAGAMGRPVWLLLPHVADWRWEQDARRSTLYPTMRLFRQSRPDDWGGLFERVRHILSLEIERRLERSRSTPSSLPLATLNLSEDRDGQLQRTLASDPDRL